ncbi:hypothetical protein HDV57DRAFT_237527 [Trichoderma longibrachiatum]
MPTQPSWAGRAVARDASRLSIPLLLLLLPFGSLDSILLRLALKRCQPWTKTPELTRLLPRSALSHQPLRFFPRPVKAGLHKVGAVGQVEERRGGEGGNKTEKTRLDPIERRLLGAASILPLCTYEYSLSLLSPVFPLTMTAATSALAPQFASCQAAAFWQPGLGLLLGSVFGRCTAISASLQTRDGSVEPFQFRRLGSGINDTGPCDREYCKSNNPPQPTMQYACRCSPGCLPTLARSSRSTAGDGLRRIQ